MDEASSHRGIVDFPKLFFQEDLWWIGEKIVRPPFGPLFITKLHHGVSFLRPNYERDETFKGPLLVM